MDAGNYEIRESSRAKRLSLRVELDGRLVVTKPKGAPARRAEAFVMKHRDWIANVQEAFRKKRDRAVRVGMEPIALPRPRRGSKAYREAREEVRSLVHARLAQLAGLHGYRYGTVSIRDQKTRWGSCSAAGNLSFNYRLLYLPPALQDYIVAHELAHTKEHNHSPAFWSLIENMVPDYTLLRRELRRYVH